MEPGYAQAWALAAVTYSHLGSLGQMLPQKAFEIVHRYADKALELNPSLAEGYIAKGAAYLFYDWKWKDAFEALQKAIEINPAATDAYELLAFYFIVMGQKQKAMETMEHAIQLDPLSPTLNYFLGNVYLFNERYAEVVEQADKLLEMDASMRSAIELKGWALGLNGNWNEALELFTEVHRLTSHPLKGLLPLGYAYAMLGRRDEAMECIRKMEKRQVEEPDAIVDSDLVGIYYALGDYDKVFYHLDKAIEKRMGPIAFFLEYPPFKKLHSDPRMAEMRRKAGLE
jgi:tetratricopeptide (TPR) repeat protein